MSFSHTLVRLNAYEGLCLTADDLLTEQLYHRRTLHRHSLFLHGYGIVQGLQVELEQRKRRYTAVIKSGYGITRAGQGVQLHADVVVPLEVPKQDGEYILWLFHVERADAESARPVFDTDESRESRVVETCAPRLHAADEEFEDGVALARIRVRVGRMVQVQLPVPRAGRQARAAESYLKPRVLEFIRLNKKALDSLFRTAILQEMGIGSFGFYSALVSAEFILIEEGTTDRVLYRTAGTLISYAHDFYNPLPSTTDRVAQFTEFIRRVNAEIPAPDQSDETWLRWFESFERLLQPMQRLADELQASADAMR
ncbi:MAG: hypothetical protein EA397_03220 [Deltaproteobacteria bacterium]|nr:MAG: hypothetical protein EA397_03220 [Deltaproteobacteria bacterium]